MNSYELAYYMSQTDSNQKPWLLVQLRLKKLQEQKSTMPPEAYAQALADIYADLMRLGEWWVGREKEVF